MSNLGSLFLYFCIFIVSTFCFSLYRYNNRVVSGFGISMAILIPVVLSGFRYGVGTDYNNYYNIFNVVKQTNWGGITRRLAGFNGEVSFLYFSKCFLTFLSIKQYFGFLTFISLSIFVKALLEQYNKYDITICYYLYLTLYFGESLNNVRQYIALSIGFYALKYIFKKKIIKFTLAIIIASLFHVTSLIMLPLYLLWDHNNIEIKPVYMSVPVLFSGIIVLCWKKILYFLVLIKIFSRERVQIYLASPGTQNRDFVVKVFLLLVLIIFFKYFKKANRNMRVYIYMYMIATILGAIGFMVGYAKRVAVYFGLPSVVVVAAIKSYIAKPISSKIYKFIVLTCSWLYFTLNYYVLRHTYLIPYNWK